MELFWETKKGISDPDYNQSETIAADILLAFSGFFNCIRSAFCGGGSIPYSQVNKCRRKWMTLI